MRNLHGVATITGQVHDEYTAAQSAHFDSINQSSSMGVGQGTYTGSLKKKAANNKQI